jgi:hypothetical protein
MDRTSRNYCGDRQGQVGEQTLYDDDQEVTVVHYNSQPLWEYARPKFKNN